ncbi:MAG: DUF3291 domain-containing protein [Alphaproteobacteria bacterium]|nr:DUF3291 domain-containing protein [Alphaproteobacteria bacterium]
MTVRYNLAQINVAKLRAPLDDPAMADFVAHLDTVNAEAEKAPGFVWRLKDDSGNATAIRPLGPDQLINMSVWKSIGSLERFVYKSAAHVAMMKRRAEWFVPMDDAVMCLWWQDVDTQPTVDEGLLRLEQIRMFGPCQGAFTFQFRVPPPGMGDDH